jgi:hypothetical protein
VEIYNFVRRRGSHIFYTIESQMAMRLSDLRTGRPLSPSISLVLISIRGSVYTQGRIAAGRIRSNKKSSDLIGNQTRDLSDCKLVHHQTTLPLALATGFILLITSNLFLYL